MNRQEAILAGINYPKKQWLLLRYVMVLLLLNMFAFSCKKAEVGMSAENSLGKAEITAKIGNWLNGKKANSGTVNAGKIASLQNNLDYAAAYTEPFKDNEQFIIVPVKDGFVTNVHADKNPMIYLFVTLNAKGEIRKTNIVQYIADDGKKVSALPKNAFTDLFVSHTAKVNGRFFFLNLLDRLTWEVGYRNGKQSSISYKQERHPATGKMECTAWYWVTTYTDGDGYSLDTEEYLYTTCDNVQTQSELDPMPCEKCIGGPRSEYNDDNDPPIAMSFDQKWTLEDISV